MSEKSAKDKIFSAKHYLQCGGKTLDLSTPVVMGILNITPDSFYDGGKHRNDREVLKRVETMIYEGAEVIDVGGASSRPGAELVSAEEEIKRVLPVISRVVKAFPKQIVAVDTFRSEVASKCVGEGAGMVNDISGGDMDDSMFETIANLQPAYLLMHMKGIPRSMQKNPEYEDVVREVGEVLKGKVTLLKEMGVNNLLIDPGFGFGKSLEHNYILLSKLNYFSALRLPLVVGISRKSMVNRVLGTSPGNALNGTTVLNTLALLNGANILRVHDVRAAREAIQLVGYYQSQ